MEGRLHDLYARLPAAAQHVVVTGYGLRERRHRYRGSFPEALGLLRESEWFDSETIEARKLGAIQRLVAHAVQHVPYYRKTYGAADIHPADIRSMADFRDLPVIEKQVVRTHPAEFRSEVSLDRSDIIEKHTSGTTGTPLRLWTTPYAVQWQWAVWWRYRNRLGLRLDDWHASFTGKLTDSHTRGQPWRTDVARRQVVVGLRSITATNVQKIVARCTRPEIRYWTGYPSIIGDLAARVVAAGGSKVAHVPVVTTGAEPMSALQRDLISTAFDVGVFSDQYGLTEAVANFSQCERGLYHEDWEFAHTDLEVCHRSGDVSIIGTSLVNDVFPLIRYNTGDGAVTAQQCDCGRHSTVIASVTGRQEDAILTPEGAQVMRFDYVFKGCEGLKEAQVVQRERGTIVILIVTAYGFSVGQLEESIRANVRKYISESLVVLFEHVPSVPRSANGKFRPVVSEL